LYTQYATKVAAMAAAMLSFPSSMAAFNVAVVVQVRSGESHGEGGVHIKRQQDCGSGTKERPD
jgi:hypothetical protein